MGIYRDDEGDVFGDGGKKGTRVEGETNKMQLLLPLTRTSSSGWGALRFNRIHGTLSAPREGETVKTPEKLAYCPSRNKLLCEHDFFLQSYSNQRNYDNFLSPFILFYRNRLKIKNLTAKFDHFNHFFFL